MHIYKRGHGLRYMFSDANPRGCSVYLMTLINLVTSKNHTECHHSTDHDNQNGLRYIVLHTYLGLKMSPFKLFEGEEGSNKLGWWPWLALPFLVYTRGKMASVSYIVMFWLQQHIYLWAACVCSHSNLYVWTYTHNSGLGLTAIYTLHR